MSVSNRDERRTDWISLSIIGIVLPTSRYKIIMMVRIGCSVLPVATGKEGYYGRGRRLGEPAFLFLTN
jgi:hypothetical protein